MGLLDSVLGAALGGQQGGQAPGAGGLDPQLLMGLVNQLLNNAGGLSGLLAKLQQGGLAEVAASWVGTGANQTITPEQIAAVLGNDKVKEMAARMGIDPAQASDFLAKTLPGLVDQLTPQGQLN